MLLLKVKLLRVKDINQRVSKIEVLLQKINFLVSNIKDSTNNSTITAEFELIRKYIDELQTIAAQNIITNDVPSVPLNKSTQIKETEDVKTNEEVIEKKVVETEIKEEAVPEKKIVTNAEPEFPAVNGYPEENDSPSLNEKLKVEEKDLSEIAVTQKVNDLKTAIDINQKFRYINELFDGDVDAFSQALNRLNNCNNLPEAQEILNVELKNKYQWDEEQEAVTSLQDFLSRRYA